MATTARIEELKKKFDENPRRYFAPLASEYRKAGMTDEAIRICREHLPTQPGHMSGHVIYGQALFDAGQRDEARAAFETALTLDPENLIALRYLGDIARERGEHAVAKNWYERYLDADPRNEEVSAQLQSLSAAPESEILPLLDVSAPARTSGGWGRVEEPSAPTTTTPAQITPDRSTSDVFTTPTRGASAQAPAAEASTQITGARPAETPPPRTDTPAAASPSAQAPATGARRTSDIARELFGVELDRSAEAAPPAGGAAATAGSETAAGGGLEQAQELDLSWLTAPSGAEQRGTDTAPAAPEPAPSPITAGASDLGLETMEFVPPSREGSEATRAAGLESTTYDPLDATMVEPGAARQGDTPAAFVTETMAELYLQQGFEQEALNVYRQLLQQNPSDQGLRDRVEQLERGARSSVGAAAISDDVIEAARSRQAAPRVRTARALFGSLAARRVAGRGGARSSAYEERPELAEGDSPSAAVAGSSAAAAYGGYEYDATVADADTAEFAAASESAAVADAGVASLPDESLPFADVPVEPRTELPSAITPSELAVMAESPAARDESSLDSLELVPAEVEARDLASPAVYDPLVDGPPGEFELPAQAGEPAAPDEANALDTFVWGDSGAPGVGAPAPAAAEPDAFATDAFATDELSADAYGEPAEAVEAAAEEPPPAAPTAYDAPGTDRVGYDLTPALQPLAPGIVARPTPAEAAAVTEPTAERPAERPAEPAAEPALEPPAAPAPAPAAPASRAAPSLGTPGGGVEALFGGARAAQRDEVAAATLAGAFGSMETAAVPAPAAPAAGTAPGAPVSGEPSRPATTPLSLDHVFREPRRAGDSRRDSLAFSFDQFFSESTPSTPERGAAAGMAADESAAEPGGGEGAANDLEQFNAWLEGLKRK